MATFYGSYIGYGTSATQAPGYAFQGETKGYNYGGYSHPAAARTAGYDRTSFTEDINAVDVGNMATGNPGRDSWAGISSATDGYQCGGYGPGAYSPNTANVIEKHTFASEGNCVDVGDLASLECGSQRRDLATSSAEFYGYPTGGHRAASDPTCGSQNYQEIQRFQMVASASGADVGDLSTDNGGGTGHSDIANAKGYTALGHTGASFIAAVDRYDQASSGSATDIGDMDDARVGVAGASSLTHGYCLGWTESPSATNRIDKYNFTGSFTATDVGNIINGAMGENCGVNSTTHGYCMGGSASAAAPYGTTNIDKVSFAADGDTTDVGNLPAFLGYQGMNGTQV